MAQIKKIILIAFLLMPGKNFFAQISDSLYRVIPDSIKPHNKENLTKKEKEVLLSEGYKFVGFFYYPEMEKLAVSLQTEIEHSKILKDKIDGISALADFYFFISKHSKAINYYDSLISLINGNKSYNTLLTQTYLNLANTYLYMYNGKLDSVIKYLHLYKNRTDSQNDILSRRNVADIYSSVYSQLQLYEKTISYNKEYLATFLKDEKWNRQYTAKRISTAATYMLWFRRTLIPKYRDSAVSIVNEVMKAKKKEDIYWYGASYYILGHLSFAENNFSSALSYFDSSLISKYVITDYYLGDPTDKKMGRAISLIKMGRYTEGKNIIDSLQLGTKLNRHLLVNKVLYEYATENSNWKDALKYHLQYSRYIDSLNVIDQKAAVFEAEQKYILAQKQASISALENKNLLSEKKQDRIIIAGGIILLVIIVILVGFYAHQKKKELKNVKEKQLLSEQFHAIEAKLTNEREAQQKKLEETIVAQRKKISSEIHDSISSGLAALRYYISDLKLGVNEHKVKELLGNIEGETASLYTQTRDFMNNLTRLTPSITYDVNALLTGFSRQFNDELSMKVITYAEEAVINKYFTRQQHYELYLVIKEAVANTLKHANASRVEISIELQNNIFNFSVKDNGKNSTLAGENQGQGINNMRERIRSIGGVLKFQTDERGTIIFGNFPIANVNVASEI